MTLILLLAMSAMPETQVLVFGASWCGPCRQAEVDYKSLPYQVGTTKDCRIWKVDGDEFPQSVKDWKVEKYPTFIVISEGREVRRYVGYPGKQTLDRELRGVK